MRSDHETSIRRLERLSRLQDCDVAAGEPDPRGWTVVDRQGHKVGEVKDLVVDTERMTASYLDVELDSKLFDFRDDDPHVLVPVERAHADRKHLVVDAITPSWVSELRTARELHHREFWNRWWDRGEPREAASGTRITRRVPASDLNRVIEDVRPGETVRIPVVDEEIVVERRPIGRPADDVVVNRADDDPRYPRRS
jgi:sporulation protein YlmC with PRC-barrel domain